MAVLLERVQSFLTARDLMRPEQLLLVAVSGGPDSLCLLHALQRLRAAGGPQLHVAHLDHGARGPQSAAEATAVAELAATWGLPVSVARRDVPALARERGEGLLSVAREVRYRWLATLARELGADALAVGHQADDQAETVLLHLIRGAGSAGLRGMRELVPWAEWAPNDEGQGPPLIRPLLAIERAAIERYCQEQGLMPSDDPSNRSERFTRVRVRRALRTLSAENPRLVAALGRTARIMADEHAYMQAQLDQAWPALSAPTATGLTLRREHWEPLHPALQRLAIRRAVALLGQPELSLEQVEGVRALFARGGPRRWFGPRLWMRADDERLELGCTLLDPQLAGPQLLADELPLVIPGSVALGGDWRLVALERVPHPVMAAGKLPPSWVRIDPATLDGPLLLRRRRPGDRFRPAGGVGSRRLQDFFVDRKLPQALRAHWPILATPAAVVWVVGLRADGRFVATEQTQGTIWVGLLREPGN